MAEYDRLLTVLGTGIFYDSFIGFADAWNKKFVGDGVVPVEEFINSSRFRIVSSYPGITISAYDKRCVLMNTYSFSLLDMKWTAPDDEFEYSHFEYSSEMHCWVTKK